MPAIMEWGKRKPEGKDSPGNIMAQVDSAAQMMFLHPDEGLPVSQEDNPLLKPGDFSVNQDFSQKFACLQKEDGIRGLLEFHRLGFLDVCDAENEKLSAQKTQLFFSLVYQLHTPESQKGQKYRDAIEVFFKETGLGKVMGATEVIEQQSAINELSRDGLKWRAARNAQAY